MMTFKQSCYMTAALAAGLLASASAEAQVTPIVGSLDVGYADTSLSGHAGSANQWDGGGAALVSLGNPGLDFQVNADADHVGLHDDSGNVWSTDGTFMWRDWAGSFGASVGYASLAGSDGFFGLKGDMASYGLFGEWYAFSMLTLQAKGGALSDSVSGGYVGAGATFYWFSDFSTNVYFNYTTLRRSEPQITDGGVTLEYLPVRSLPVSFYVGYDYTSVDRKVGFGNTILAGLKFHIGDLDQGTSLRDYQRTGGTTEWNGIATPGGGVHL